MAAKIGMLHTSLVFVTVEHAITELFAELLPDAELAHFVDSDVLATVMREGRISVASTERMRHLAQAADAAGVDLIFSACSSLGPAVDAARAHVVAPIVKIDEAMAVAAVAAGPRVGVLATVATTLEPTSAMVRAAAAETGRDVEVTERLADGAFEVLMDGDRSGHDAMVSDAARALAGDVDVIVLAQASMNRLAGALAEASGVRVLASPRSGVERVRDVLAGAA